MLFGFTRATCIWERYAIDNSFCGTPRANLKKPIAGRSPTGPLSTAAMCRGLEKNGMVGARHGHSMESVNQTRRRCVNQMGKTHSKPLAARHGRGTACYVWIGLYKAETCSCFVHTDVYYTVIPPHILFVVFWRNVYLKYIHSLCCINNTRGMTHLNTLRRGDANLRFLRFCITTVKDRWRKSAFLARAWFPCTSLHNTWSVSPNGTPGRIVEETWRHSELKIYDKYRGKKYPSSMC
jgi:hypothetical protein